MDGQVIDVSVCSDLYVAGRTEDGEMYTAEGYLVCAEFADGSVYAHSERFKGCKIEEWADEDDHGTAFVDIREEQKAKAEKLAARVNQCVATGRKLDPQFWTFHRTVYGSSAYLHEVAEMTPRQRAGEPD
jgi:hypothetical protein